MRRVLACLVAAVLAVSLAGSAPAVAAVPPAELVILTMGDSITCGSENCAVAAGYRVELGRLLADAGVNYRFVLAATGGAGCGAWVPHAESLVREHRPQIVMLACGTNDVPGSAFEAAYYQLLSGLLSGNGWGTRVIPAWISYSAVPPAPAWLRDSEPRVNDAIYRVVIPSVWRAEGRIPAVADLQSLPEAYLDSGGIHPTAAGYTVMGRLFYNALREPYPALPGIPPTCGLTGRRPGSPPPAYLPCTTLAGP